MHINHGGGQTLCSGGPEKNGHFGRDRLALCCGSRTQQAKGAWGGQAVPLVKGVDAASFEGAGREEVYEYAAPLWDAWASI